MSLRDSNTSNNIFVSVHDATWESQTFTPSVGYDISYVELLIYRVGSPGNTIVSIYATAAGKPTGSPLATVTSDMDSLSTSASGVWTPFIFSSPYTLVASTMYAIVVSVAGVGAGNSVNWRASNANPFATGTRVGTVDSGSNWSIDAATDYAFKTYDGAYLQPVDKTYTKKLIAIGGDEVWTEETAGTLSELTAANGDIDTTKKLTAVEAYQKVFIANETNLKVIDFINTKIVTADIGANPPDVGNILTSDATGSPKMVVDYITSTTGASTIYGKRITTDTFTASGNITGTDNDGNAISFAQNGSAEVAPPHWYDYTVYGGLAAGYGALPTEAYLIARYRGRIVLSGHPDYPHQWWMSRIGFPFDHLFTNNDPLTGLKGNNIDAGEIGDIVKALIPYGDDYMIMGAASSIHLMDGDPGYGGSIDELDNTTGIFGPHAWCKDSKGNLYFWGANGIYKMEGGRSRPQNISEGSLPSLVKDWNVDVASHRIVLSYDPFEHGIIVSKTTMATGVNLNYFFDLKTQGFYPENYPVAAAITCGHNYDADAAGTRGIIVGGWDGYIRRFDPDTKDDDTSSSTAAISSYVTLEMLDMNQDQDDHEGRMNSLTIELGGGRAGGSFGDSDGASWDIHVGDDAETVLEEGNNSDLIESSIELAMLI